jgi:hypothetical protein
MAGTCKTRCPPDPFRDSVHQHYLTTTIFRVWTNTPVVNLYRYTPLARRPTVEQCQDRDLGPVSGWCLSGSANKWMSSCQTPMEYTTFFPSGVSAHFIVETFPALGRSIDKTFLPLPSGIGCSQSCQVPFVRFSYNRIRPSGPNLTSPRSSNVATGSPPFVGTTIVLEEPKGEYAISLPSRDTACN